MEKTPIKQIRSGYKSTGDMNDNFEELEDRIDNSLARTAHSDGSPNQMETELDMNTRRIINVGDAVNDSDAVNKRALDTAVDKVSAEVNAAVGGISVPNSDDTLFLSNLSQLKAFDQSTNTHVTMVFLRKLDSSTRDYRGGWFEWDVSSTDTDDDGYSTVRPSNVGVNDAGRWKRLDKDLEPIVVAAMGQSNMQQNDTRSTTVSDFVFRAQGPYNSLATSVVDNGNGTVTATHTGYMNEKVRVYRPSFETFGPIPTGDPLVYLDPFDEGLNNVALGFCNRLAEETGRRVYLILFAKGGRPFESFLINDPRDPVTYADFDPNGANWTEFNDRVVTGLAALGRTEPDVLLIHLMEAHSVGTIGNDAGDTRSSAGGISTPEGFNQILDEFMEQIAEQSWGSWDLPVIAGEGYYRSGDRQGADRNAELSQWPDRRHNVAVASSEGYYANDGVHFDNKHDFGYYRYFEAGKSVLGNLLEDYSGGKPSPNRDWLIKSSLNSRGTLGYRLNRRFLTEGATVTLEREDLTGMVMRGRANRINLPTMSTNGRDDGLVVRLYMYSISLPSGVPHPDMSSAEFPDWTRGCVLDFNGSNIRNIQTNQTITDGYLVVDNVSYVELMWYSGQWLLLKDDRPKVEDITSGFMDRNSDNALEICQTLTVTTTRDVDFSDISGFDFADDEYFIDVKYIDNLDNTGSATADKRIVDTTEIPGVTNITATGMTLVNNLGFPCQIRYYVRGRK